MNKQRTQVIVFGVHPIEELLKAKKRRLLTIYTTKPQPKAWFKIEKILPKEVQIQYVSSEVLARLAGTTDHQGLVAYATPIVMRSKFFNPQTNPFLIMLDGIQDARNLGAILRSAYCTGVTGVILCTKNSAPLNGVAVKSSAGLVEHLEIYNATTPVQAAQELKNAGYSIYFGTLNGKDACSIEYKQPLCIVIGNEAVGVSKSILPFGTEVKLPQRNADISYNASVAAGILLFMIATQSKII